ncbi:protein NETWORKED 3C-like [Andrographis paniculata]|uniref:protein NETWORKED 3C-like n=1 Tax=Andrographis paniculata TaxID=175694 RepID=UPI0021E7ABFF|nr:protein NETWORKED 3C-like [Andrographis paniculata]XP_051141607.1 protein NETWORKED 3C-like [Andrographis paniculata]XP_051141608.1 protein NETWORKED 3C-like [Andrographis paniculata]XP_051141609.1 protein NETWORKED 3C-like [Andrographis paniculata]XP_051141610.1 protein NETWORKED 3C-like [Andrographis paniculata]
MEVKSRDSSHWWWFDGHINGNSKKSPWLQSTLADLEEKTKAMLKVIEEDADSFAQRAEMYYNKRPELITMVEDFYRTHRSLAEKYDHQVKPEPIARVLTPWSSSSPFSFTKFHLERSPSLYDKTYDSYSEANGPEESDESEVDEDEQTHGIRIISGLQQVASESKDEELISSLREELEKLREANRVQAEELMQKDEEKREVIRQLSLAMDVLREENDNLRNCVAKKEEKQVKEGNFLARLFDGFGKSRANVVAI